MEVRSRFGFVALRRAALLGATMLAGTSVMASAQTPAQGPALNPAVNATTPPVAQDNGPSAPAVANGQVTPPPGMVDPALGRTPDTAVPSGEAPSTDDIVVTGYRKSLAESTTAKRNATGFTDSIFAEDIGKFPDTNIAESFNRIPGITISRDITGQGVNVAIRGLGSNFTEVTLNGSPIQIASSGTTDAQGTDRSVDLSFFPTDLFTKLTVNKSFTADLLEGGAAGNVDIRSARPFDRPGTHFTYNLQGVDQVAASGPGFRGSAIASTTFGDTFGVLVGVQGNHDVSRVNGYETIGYTNPNLTAAQCGTGNTCNTTGGGNFTIPSTVPANAGNGLVAGTTIDQAFLLAHNPGATIQQIDNGLLPRLGRPSDEFGTRDRVNGILSVEWRPSDSLRFYVDSLYGWKKNDLQRIDMDWVVRNSAIIPLNETFDTTNCSAGCAVTSGTYANAQFFLEYRPYIETTHFVNVNPGGVWKIANNLSLDFQGNYSHSDFHRESPSVVVVTPASSGTTVNFTNGVVPTIGSNIDLNNPANFVWANGGRVNIQDERRSEETKGFRANLTWGGDRLNLKVGGNYDVLSRSISAFDNSQAYQNAVCGNNPNVFVPTPNSQPPCAGLSQAGTAPAGYPTYPGYGTGYTAGQTGPVTYAGSLIPVAQLASYLKPGPAGFVTVDWNKFANASNYNLYHNAEPSAGAANTGASGGYIQEKDAAAFAEVNGVHEVAGSDLRFNIGLRYVHTDQTIGGMVSLPNPLNTPATGTAPLDGGKYPNVSSFVYTRNGYSNWLPAANFAWDLGEHAVARFAASRTMTRPDPNAQLPGVNFSTPSADVASIGNPALKPYLSTNLDLGIEYYTGHEGLVSVAAFRKLLTGFTTNGTVTLPFNALAVYGITYDSLTPTQQAAITARGGPNAASVQVTQQVNATGTLAVDGLEFQWVQPLDFVTERFGVKGFGFNANATVIDQKGSGAAPAIALGVAEYTYNISGYYENHGVSLRLSTTFTKGSQISNPGQNGLTNGALFSNDYRQYDFSSIFDLEKIFHIAHGPQVTFDVVNLTKSRLRSYFEFSNETYTYYNPGRTFLFGIRGSF